MDEVTARQRLAYILGDDDIDDSMGAGVAALVTDHMAAIRSRSGGGWDRIIAAEYISELERSIESEKIDEPEDEEYEDAR